jgi:Ser/Thr protein kinase RdoA (MazF antagonist)
MMTDVLPKILLEAICSNYGLCEIQEIQTIWLGLENHNYLLSSNGKKRFLQTSNTVFQPDLFAFKTKLLDWLVKHGMTECVAAIATIDDELYLQLDEIGAVVLYPARPQQHRFLTEDTPDQQAGISLSNWIASLHNLTVQTPDFVSKPKETLVQNFQTLKAYYPVFEKIGLALPNLPLDEETRDIWRKFLEKTPHYSTVLFADNRVFKLLESTAIHTTLVHNDLNLSNLSFDDSGNLVRVYDFDKAGLDNRVADLQFIYYYYYHPSVIQGNEWFDEPKLRSALSHYENATGQIITADEKLLCAMLGMDRSLRGLLWMFDMLTKGTPLEMFSGVDYRIRPNNPSEEGSPPYQTFAKLFNGIACFSNIERYLSY